MQFLPKSDRSNPPLICRLLLPLLASLWLWLSGLPPVAGQPLAPGIEPPPQAAVPANLSASDISSSKVSQFVQAYLEVLQLVEERQGALQGALTQLEAQQLEREIETEALARITASGLSWQEYLQLLSLANTDLEFGERVATQLQEQFSH